MSCCTEETQQTCCAVEEKDECCGSGGCGCQ